MSEKFEVVRNYLLDMDMKIVREEEGEEVFVVEDLDNGIRNLIIDCEAPLLVLEQLIMAVADDDREDLYRRLLQMNRTLIHGAFVLDEEAKYVFFRDTLQIDNLDFNELEGSIHALTMGLAENADELLAYAKK